MKRILSALLLTLLSVTATAQEQERPDRWYEVEVLVFKQQSGENGEAPPPAPARIDTAGSIDLVAAKGGSAPYQILPPENYRLRSAFNKLSASKRYQPLLHTAWRQSVPPRERADRIHLSGNGVDGVISIGVSRFLHVTADLLLPPGTADAAGKFRIQDALRMRSGEVHYIDHPLGGVLMLFTPYNP